MQVFSSFFDFIIVYYFMSIQVNKLVFCDTSRKHYTEKVDCIVLAIQSVQVNNDQQWLTLRCE